MFWFDKQDGRAIYADRRTGIKDMDVGTPSTKGRTPAVVAPDVLHDFTAMQFKDNTFWHVVFDPPHLENAGTGIIAFKYGSLTTGWRDMLRDGFAECFRVLKPHGTLIFKWCEVEIPLREVLALTPEKPLYGHRSGKKAQTHWVAFMKPGGIDGC
jgi:23S rRNA G2069 N7-methylase RlmK/C1962 C5-methylase RlmI